MTTPGMAGVETQGIRDNADRLGLVWKRRPATIVGVESTDPTKISATMDGDTVAINVYSLIGLLPVGARVMCDIVPPSGVYVIGYLGEPGGVFRTNVATLRFAPASPTSFSTSSSSYGNITGANFTFTKLYMNSSLHVDLKTSGFSTGTGASAVVGISVGGTSYDMATLRFNVQQQHLSFSGDRLITDPYAPGAYVVQVIFKVVGTLTYTTDFADLTTVTMTEIV